MTTKELLDEYAIISRDDEDFYPNTERMQEIVKEIEASIRREVVEEYVREGYCEGMLDARDVGGNLIINN